MEMILLRDCKNNSPNKNEWILGYSIINHYGVFIGRVQEML
jgi:hypothetical protein